MGQIQTWWSDLPNETLTETAWERQMNISGLEAYERGRTDKNGKARKATDLVAGQKFIRKLLDRATHAIETMQKSLIVDARAGRNLRGTVIVVPAETCALLTLKPLIDRTYSAPDPEKGVVVQGVAIEVAKAVELELNFRHWVQESRGAARVYAATEGLVKVPKSQAERLIEEHGISRRGLYYWRQTFEELSTYKWDTLEKHYCGDALVSAVVEELSEFFQIENVRIGVRTPKMVRMTPEFRKDFDKMEFQIASGQISKKPMITRPKRWERTE